MLGSINRTSRLSTMSMCVCSSSVPSNLPTNTAQPTVTGSNTPTEEATTDKGTWVSSSSVTFSYQWQLDGVDIVGATTNTLLLLLAWVGKTIRCVVKCTNSFGFRVAFSTSFVVSL